MKKLAILLLIGSLCVGCWSDAIEVSDARVDNNPSTAAQAAPQAQDEAAPQAQDEAAPQAASGNASGINIGINAAVTATPAPAEVLSGTNTNTAADPADIDPARLAAENRVPRRPFPQHAHDEYAVAPMMPTNLTQAQVDQKMADFMSEILRFDMIVDANSPQNKDEFRLVFRHYQAWAIRNNSIQVSHLTVSESHGYGMIMLAYMAGGEALLNLEPEEWLFGTDNLKDYFDAMVRTVLAFPSVSHGRDNRLFAWEINGNPRDGSNRRGYTEVNGMNVAPFSRPSNGTSATDGCMDVIYALLLADAQWGSEGIYDYKQIALDMLASFWQYCVHTEFHTLRLGDWAFSSAGVLRDATRPSDFIISHLRAYAEADPHHDWQKVIDATLDVVQQIRREQTALGNLNGFLPDFVVRGDGFWFTPDGRILEGDNDGAFAYNACRVPWRMGTDYMLYGDTPIGDSTMYAMLIEPLDKYARGIGNPGNFGPTRMDGVSVGWTDPMLFTPPFVVTAAATGADQEWLNTLWSWRGLDDYRGDNYADYIKMICMLTASGNYWRP